MKLFDQLKALIGHKDVVTTVECPELCVITKDCLQDFIKQTMVVRFLHDMNQGKNGDLHMPAGWLDDASEAIDTAVQMAMEKMDEEAIICTDKIKMYFHKDGSAIVI